MNIFISGGCKNGKSYYAQKAAQKMASDDEGRPVRPLYYIATMIPLDDEDHARIQRHLKEREGWGFETLEQGRDLTALLDDPAVDKTGVFLLDSVTALLQNEMFRAVPDGQGGMDYIFDEDAAERVRRDCAVFAESTGNTVFVSDGIYSDAEKYGGSVEKYKKALAMADRTLAGACDRVVEISAGCEEIWKGIGE